MIPFWCLMPKGEKLRPKQMDQLPLVNFENNRVRTFDLQKQTKWWQRMIEICQIRVKNNLVFNCIDIALLLVAFGCVGINHQKGGD
jgi:hypothetical protein